MKLICSFNRSRTYEGITAVFQAVSHSLFHRFRSFGSIWFAITGYTVAILHW